MTISQKRYIMSTKEPAEREGKTMYCVIVGDIIDSRQLDFDERQHTTETIEKIFMEINYNYRENILSDFGLVRGDSFEGVLFSQYRSLKIIRDIIRQVYEKAGQRLRICAAIDELSVVSSDRNKADGPAFHVAVEELEKLKGKKSTHWLQVALKTKDDMAQPLIDTTLELLSCLTAEWTDKQRELVWSLPDYSGQQNLLSKAKDTKTSVVNKQLKAANYQAYSAAWEALESYLSRVEETKTATYTDYYSVAMRKYNAERDEEAIPLFEKALELAKEEFGEESPNLLPIYLRLAETCLIVCESDKDRLTQAEAYIREARVCLHGETQTEEYAGVLAMKGKYHFARREWKAAIDDYQDALWVGEKVLPAVHPFLYACHGNIGNAYYYLDDFEEALAQYEICKNYDKERDTVEYADDLHNIALVYEKMGEIGTAIQNLEECLTLRMDYLPANNPDICWAQSKLKELRDKR